MCLLFVCIVIEISLKPFFSNAGLATSDDDNASLHVARKTSGTLAKLPEAFLPTSEPGRLHVVWEHFGTLEVCYLLYSVVNIKRFSTLYTWTRVC